MPTSGSGTVSTPSQQSTEMAQRHAHWKPAIMPFLLPFMLLLAVYSAGLAVPFLIAAVAVELEMGEMGAPPGQRLHAGERGGGVAGDAEVVAVNVHRVRQAEAVGRGGEGLERDPPELKLSKKGEAHKRKVDEGEGVLPA